jgi:hypothetical protein
VLVEVGRRRHPCQAVDISAHGAKVTPRIWLRSGTSVRLQFVPPEGQPLRVGALVWRIDADGLAFFFEHSIYHPVIRAVWRECSSEWAAQTASKLHPQLAPMDVTHVTRVEGPESAAGGEQLPLTQLVNRSPHARPVGVSSIRLAALPRPS